MKLALVLSFSLALLVSPVMAQDTVQLYPGWNNIAALRTGAVPEIVTAVPPGIIVSPFYRYSPGAGYSSADALTRGAGYWVRVNESGLIIFSDPAGPSCPAEVSWGGKTYNTVLIGMQCWFRENLDIGTMVSGLQNQTNNSVIEKYCYNDSLVNCSTYGGMYQWDEAMEYLTTPGAQGICPPGWHIPTLVEFQTLNVAVVGNGNALKAVGQGSGAGAGTNTSGFSALLEGRRTSDGFFQNLGSNGYFWSSTQFNASNAHDLFLYSQLAWFEWNSVAYNLTAFGVRCLKD